jgi:hypothetical protein
MAVSGNEKTVRCPLGGLGAAAVWLAFSGCDGSAFTSSPDCRALNTCDVSTAGEAGEKNGGGAGSAGTMGDQASSGAGAAGMSGDGGGTTAAGGAAGASGQSSSDRAGTGNEAGAALGGTGSGGEAGAVLGGAGSGGEAGAAADGGGEAGAAAGGGNESGASGASGTAGSTGSTEELCEPTAPTDACTAHAVSAWFVAPQGSDEAEGSVEAPLRTLEGAMARNLAMPRPILVCATATDVYTESLTVADTQAPVTLLGGFDCETWHYGAHRQTRLESAGSTALSLRDLDGAVRIANFAITAVPGELEGESSIGVSVVRAVDVELRNVTISAGRGRDGVSQLAFDAPAPFGLTANPGVAACAEGTEAGVGATALTLECPSSPSSTGGRGGHGGTATRAPTGGGDGLPPDEDAAVSGEGLGGLAQSQGSWACTTHGNGNDGAPGVDGEVGAGGPLASFDAAGTYVPGDGTPGGAGVPGQGGGGGGGQLVPAECTATTPSGASGGSGATGGCGGSGGPAGTGGGASIALLSIDSMVSLEAATLIAGLGGDGGDAAPGQLGGDGGVAASPPGSCRGGHGGRGGRGGPGGSGSGGHSAAVAFLGEEPLFDPENTTLANQDGGVPGEIAEGAAETARGAAGIGTDVLDLGPVGSR